MNSGLDMARNLRDCDGEPQAIRALLASGGRCRPRRLINPGGHYWEGALHGPFVVLEPESSWQRPPDMGRNRE